MGKTYLATFSKTKQKLDHASQKISNPKTTFATWQACDSFWSYTESEISYFLHLHLGPVVQFPFVSTKMVSSKFNQMELKSWGFTHPRWIYIPSKIINIVFKTWHLWQKYPRHPTTSWEGVLGMFLGCKYRTSGGVWMSRDIVISYRHPPSSRYQETIGPVKRKPCCAMTAKVASKTLFLTKVQKWNRPRDCRCSCENNNAVSFKVYLGCGLLTVAVANKA